MTLSGAEGISSLALKKFVGGFREASSIDLSGTANVEDVVVKEIAESCEMIQAINMAGCKSVGDEGLKAIAERRKMLRRVSRTTERALLRCMLTTLVEDRTVSSSDRRSDHTPRSSL